MKPMASIAVIQTRHYRRSSVLNGLGYLQKLDILMAVCSCTQRFVPHAQIKVLTCQNIFPNNPSHPRADPKKEP
ncbi:MAG: hypothetical protein KatS3mg029_0530 [Saprospiraceae bacterium]|nr:MAG: hypothetical protein KatS3mg029_0530 [Saprospiraceae bacterium]